MAQQTVTELIEIAKAEYQKQLQRMANTRKMVSMEDFKTLFTTRAQQAMADRKNFTKFIIDDNNRNVINLLFKYVTLQECELNTYVGIILNGKYGCGKSVLIETLCMVLNDLTWSEKNKIQSVHAIELAEQIKKVGVIPYAHKPLLIQDLGKEKKEINNFGTIVNPISELLAIRAEYGAMTFGSTNMNLKSFGEAYKEFISKRITEHVNLVFLPGEDRRPDFSINQPK
jgi:DNA replication protein DnaC